MPKRTSLIAVIVAGVFGLFVFRACLPTDQRPPSAAAATAPDSIARQAQADAQARQIAMDGCTTTIADKRARYTKLLDEHKFWDAQLVLGDCPHLLNDAALVAMQRGAVRLSYLDTVGKASSTDDQRLNAIGMLRSNFPDDVASLEPLRQRLQAKVDARDAATVKKAAADEKARKRKQGVSLGMTAEDALASSWGRPRNINRSTYSFGVHEQWVYDGGYLYFQNGILTSIQN
jgi:hypothetical protein